MFIECEVLTEGRDAIVVNFDADLGPEYGIGISIGTKKYKKPGHFEYKWLASELSRHEIEELIAALVFTLDHLPEESDICNDCVAEGASA